MWTLEEMAVKKKANPEATEKTALPEDEEKRLVDDAIEKSEKLAESQLDMAQLFISHGKADVARRRLEDLIERYGRSEAANEARKMLKRI
jgi:FimV-like protein